jgi:hypothetical protein
LQLTPLRGPEIVAILKADYNSTAIPIYRCGATEAQTVGWRIKPIALGEQLSYNRYRVISSLLLSTVFSWRLARAPR